MGALSRCSPIRSTQSCAVTGSCGSVATWSNGSSPSGPAAVRRDDPRQRARAVVSAAASRLRCVVVPRLQRAQALFAAAVLASTGGAYQAGRSLDGGLAAGGQGDRKSV